MNGFVCNFSGFTGIKECFFLIFTVFKTLLHWLMINPIGTYRKRVIYKWNSARWLKMTLKTMTGKTCKLVRWPKNRFTVPRFFTEKTVKKLRGKLEHPPPPRPRPHGHVFFVRLPAAWPVIDTAREFRRRRRTASEKLRFWAAVWRTRALPAATPRHPVRPAGGGRRAARGEPRAAGDGVGRHVAEAPSVPSRLIATL